MSSTLSRRNFFRLATDALVTLPSVAGGFLAITPDEALAAEIPYASDIDGGTLYPDEVKAEIKTKRKPSKAVANKVEHAKWTEMARSIGMTLKANDNCVMCGQCAKLCPTGNIRYQGKAVIFGDKCISCCACVQYCPKEAINFGNITKKRERYHNANVTVEELTKDIISF